jgi:hypothetical protein
MCYHWGLGVGHTYVHHRKDPDANATVEVGDRWEWIPGRKFHLMGAIMSLYNANTIVHETVRSSMHGYLILRDIQTNYVLTAN